MAFFDLDPVGKAIWQFPCGRSRSGGNGRGDSAAFPMLRRGRRQVGPTGFKLPAKTRHRKEFDQLHPT